ncbi:chorismate mutase [Streptomyces erythrochromogenes]|uniref:chorismate mutase n=1 Tax=Streptomyces erythrochromogenes TaxID=285574 RepID=UPI00386855C8|nr:chorismate mutase [Streptomyces erythrochromogenes]
MAHAEPAVLADVASLRADLNVVDAEIRALLERRRALSREVQRTRLASGGTRTDLSREMHVIAPYTEAYGRQGTAIAMAVLEICRGASVPTP